MDTQETLLIVEDDEGLQTQLRWCFSDEYKVVLARDRQSALAQLRRFEPPVIILDLGLPPMPAGPDEGLATLHEILTLVPTTKVIVVTGNQDQRIAVSAVGAGAYDFCPKPAEPELLTLIVRRAFHLYHLERQNRILQTGGGRAPLVGIIASSPQMLEACRIIERLAPMDVTTLLLGESGTGKELLAHALHNLSPRAKGPFVAINCASIPDSLLETELFGYEKGAYTGAAKQTLGKIECAHSGTLMLDEVGDLPLPLQGKLLRFLQERTIERVGGRKEIGVDVRVVCATHRDLGQLIAEGAFRQDLFYRISEITVRIPPLRDRVGDAVLLARVFLDRFARELRRSVKGFTEIAIQAIENHDWPGNVRELENRVKRAVIMADGKQITPRDLELETDREPEALNLREIREIAERRAILRAIARTNNNLSRAAQLLGITRPTLYSLLHKYGLRT